MEWGGKKGNVAGLICQLDHAEIPVFKLARYVLIVLSQRKNDVDF
jgi:hypothetical protein